ncbi:hypothetical protein DWG20_00255 [Crenobacter cavernae]|uniref:Uncharacterized protein n=2 Tax=Crenobacter cavernae TaxID=2290923 RepID=A0A345Y233_9NEIS|nr:hypothetical protein DWG20_00255 [Crenobacter cavernae]
MFTQLKSAYPEVGWVRLLFQAAVVPDKTKNMFTLKPTTLYYEKPVEPKMLSSDTRNLAVSIAISKAGDPKSVIASTLFPFREVPPKTYLGKFYFAGSESPAYLAPTLTDKEKANLAKLAEQPDPPSPWTDRNYQAKARTYCAKVAAYNNKLKKGLSPIAAPECPVDANIAKLELTAAQEAFQQRLKDNDPPQDAPTAIDMGRVTVSASVTEMKEPRKFLTFISKVAVAAAPGISAALEAKLPANRAAAGEAEKQDYEAYQLAVSNVQVAQAKYDAETDPVAKYQKKYDLDQAKVAANRAARQAGRAEPYTIM